MIQDVYRHRLKAVCVVVTLFFFLLSIVSSFVISPKIASADDAWWNGSFQKRLKLTFDNTGRGDLTNFPVAVKLDSARITYADFLAGGADVRFVDADGNTVLNHQIEKWDSAGTSVVWVKVPQISSASTTDYIYMYYANAATTSTATTTGVWDSNYVLVDHMNSDPAGTAPQSLNSVTNVAIGTTTAISTTTGQVGDAYNLNGTSAFVGWGTSTFPVLDNGTVEMWYNPDTLASDRYLFSNVKAGSTVQGEWRAFIDSANSFKVKFLIECGSTQNLVLSNSAASTTSGWSHAAFVWNDTGGVGNQKMYIDSVQQTQTGNTACGMEVNDNYAAGKNNGLNNSFFAGQMDELRISNIVRSPDWIDATYDTVRDTMITYGTTSSLPSAPTAASAIPYDSKVRLSWTAPAGTITDYVIEYKLSSSDTWLTFSEAVSNATSSLVTGLTNNSLYNFRVSAVSAQGQGTPSSTVTSTPTQVMTFVSPTITNGMSTSSTSITAYASTTLSASSTPDYFTFRLETSGGTHIASATTSTRYGNYSLANLTEISHKQNLSLTGDLSDQVYVPTTNTLFTVHNNQNTITEVTRAGVAVRTITCSTCGDIEGITLVSSVASSTVGGYDHTFMISTEDQISNLQIFRVVIHSTGAVTVNRNDYFETGLTAAASNDGLEGIAYNPNTGTYFVAIEGQATQATRPRIYEVTLGSGHSASSVEVCSNINIRDYTTEDNTSPYGNTTYADISGLNYVASVNRLYAISHKGDEVVEIDVSNRNSCTVLNQLETIAMRADSGSNHDFEMPEGAAWDSTGDYMYVSAEADYWSVWRTTAYDVRTTFSGLADGTYNLYTSVTDTYGVTSTSSARSFTVNTDATAPTITNITSDVTDGTYRVGNVVDIDVTFSENVTSTGNVTITLETGSTDRTCTFTVSGTNTGTCNYTVQAGDTSGDLDVLSIAGTIADGGGNALTNFVPTTNLAANKAIVVDGGSAGATNETTNTNSNSSVVPGSQTAVSGSSFYSQAQLKEIFGQYYTPSVTTAPQISALKGVPVNLESSHILGTGISIKQNASQGNTGPEILIIQKVLNSFKETRVSEIGAGSPGKETNKYGPATKQAVQKFQLLFKIVSSPKDPGYGHVGPKTKAKINELLKR